MAWNSARQAASSRLNIQLIAKAVHSQRDISKSLNEVLSESHALWAGVDPVIYNASTARQIILETIRNKIPFMAFSGNFVKAGALVALECDYFDNGKQAGEIAAEVLGRGNTSSFGVSTARRITIIINGRTARTIGLKIEKNVLREATVI